MKKIGILGGTFDPVHLGHIGLAQAALHELMLNEVLLMPANKQPFKKNKHVEDASKRLRMIELAISNYERIGVTDIELQSEGLSYTYDTMIKLMKLKSFLSWEAIHSFELNHGIRERSFSSFVPLQLA